MPSYCFECENCKKLFTEIRRLKNFSRTASCECGSTGNLCLDIPTVIFKNPKDTSKWDNFEYRAGYNMEAAKQERRDAEAREKDSNPYGAEIQDYDRKGVFDKGGIDNDETPGLSFTG